MAQQRAQDARRRAAAVLEAVHEEQAVERTTRREIELADVLNGGNRLGLKLDTYVLLQQFDAVVAAANHYLRTMSQDAYSLRTTEDVIGGKRHRGLGLRVLDHRTDRERPIGTLSGGETFYTALALALGLAEAVQDQSGGLELDTLFVDEGFGSLDADTTLDDVLDVLDTLRAGGRTLGVISHVAEMKERIRDRIEVRRPDPHGPSVVRVVAG